MLPLERQNTILELVRERRAISVEELCRQLYSSGATIRRDLKMLEQSGLLRRTHGGAVFVEDAAKDSPAMLREAEKRGIVVENSEIKAYIAEQKELMSQYIADNPEIADSIAAYYREQGITADGYYETSDGNEQCRKAVMLKKLAEKLKDDYDKATASQEVKELKSATKLYEELYRKRYEKATILINQKNVDGYIETYHIKKSVT